MDLQHRLEPAMAAGFHALPAISIADLPAARAGILAAPRTPERAGVRRTDRVVPGLPGRPDITVRVYEPAAPPADDAPARPGLLWLHGGGYVMGHVFRDDAAMDRIVAETGCVAVSAEWRQAPEDPYPASLDDAEGALRWMASAVDELGVDPALLMLGGGSSGGGTATALALRLRAARDIPIALLLLVYPMIDDTGTTPSSHAITDRRLWNREANTAAWAAYLGESAGGPNVAEEAAPARALDLTGFPPTWLAVGDLDLFLDEDIAFAQRLMSAGVPTELHVYPGAIHGFYTRLPDSPLAQRFCADMDAAVRRLVAGEWPRGTGWNGTPR